MNSSQRRKQKREFTHVITIAAESGMRYFEHDERVINADKWCRKNSKGGHRVSTGWDSAEFKFAKEKDAVHFALKWL